MAAVAVSRVDMSVSELRAAAKRAVDTRQAFRMLAIAMVLEGYSRAAAAQACGMDRQTLRDWVHRDNQEGLSGLADRPRSGRPARLSPAQEADVVGWVEADADLAVDGVVRFRLVDLCKRISERFGVSLNEDSVGKILRRRRYRRLSTRPQHPEADLAAQEAFKNFHDLVQEALGERATERAVEIWFQDEARIGQQGTLTRIWAKRGSRPRALRDRRFDWAYLFGAVCPARGVGAALVMPTVNADAMNKHLAEISQCVTPGAIAVLVIDGAGWHRAGALVVPENIVLLKLPAYAPELNPVENIWEYLRSNAFGHQVWETYEAILDACCDAWKSITKIPDLIKSIARRKWAEVRI